MVTDLKTEGMRFLSLVQEKYPDMENIVLGGPTATASESFNNHALPVPASPPRPGDPAPARPGRERSGAMMSLPDTAGC